MIGHLCFYPKNSATDSNTENERVDKNMKKLCGELAWYVQALETQKTSSDGVPN